MKRRAPLAVINVTPLVDVLLILVAVLLLLAPELIKRLPVDLPRTSLEGSPHQQRSLLLTLDRDGRLFFEDQPLALEDALSRITAEVTTVEIAASGQLPYARVVRVVETLRAGKPREILLLTR